jgi:hypothetical protein
MFNHNFKIYFDKCSQVHAHDILSLKGEMFWGPFVNQ